MKRYVLHDEVLGVYLGRIQCADPTASHAFWSKIDSPGPQLGEVYLEMPYAVTFSSMDDVRAHKALWQGMRSAKAVKVECASEYATIDECVAAGLPRWDPKETFK